jgi:hypothetical protein
MSSLRRTLALTVTMLFAPPAAAVAMPIDPLAVPTPESRPVVERAPAAVVRDGGDVTLAVLLSGAALVVAVGGAGYAGRVGHRVSRPSR